jgi:hypothetical protein
VALALCGASGPEAQRAIDRLLAEGGAADFASRWLAACGLPWAAGALGEFCGPPTQQGDVR